MYLETKTFVTLKFRLKYIQYYRHTCSQRIFSLLCIKNPIDNYVLENL